MAKRGDPWFKFFPLDWLEDTRRLTLEQRGAYIDAIALQMASEQKLPIGTRKNSKSEVVDDFSWLAHKMHVSERKAEAIVNALVEAMMLRRVAGGVSNPRCEREIEAKEELRKVSQLNGTQGGRPARSPKPAQPSANAGSTSAQARADAGSKPAQARPDAGPALAQLPLGIEPTLSEAEKPSKINETSDRPGSGQDQKGFPTRAGGHARSDPETDLDTDTERKIPPGPPEGGSVWADRIQTAFDNFWETYPPGRKRGRGKAWDTFNKIVRGQHKNRRATIDQLLEGVRRYAASDPDPDYTPLPDTWLNGGRWLDDLPEPARTSEAPKRPADFWWRDNPDTVARVPVASWRKAIADYANGTWPVEVLGPGPWDQAGCLVPKDLIAELQLRDKYPNDNGKKAGH